MIEQILDLPPGTLGLTAIGKVTTDDYESVIVPDIEAAFAINRKVRMLYHLGEQFDGFETGAVWDDAKLGFRHFTGWDRIAMVTDVGAMRSLARVVGMFVPADIRVFPNGELAAAKAWISEPMPANDA